MSEDLSMKHCEPCEGGVKPFTEAESQEYLEKVEGWELVEGKKIQKNTQFKNFVELMNFVNGMAQVAESEGHHPDFFVSYNKLTITIWTHAIGGLSENDFILAKKLDNLAAS
jgi:4a-hydroxytetrahydrobiopterin dehydratase